MKRMLSLAAAVTLICVALVFAMQPGGGFPSLDWAKKAAAHKPRVAVLLEFGHKDISLRDWSGQASVTGAKLVHREGYRFRTEDKLVGASAWEAKSHTALRVPKGNPAVSKLQTVATVGIVYHLEDVQPDAKLSVTLTSGEKADIAVVDIIAGKTQALWNGTAAARLLTTATPVAVSNAEEDHPAAAHGPDGTLWVAYISYTRRDDKRRIETVPMKEQPKDFKSFYKPEFSEQLFVKSFKDGKWSEPIAITDAKQDIARCAIAVDGQANVRVVYSAHRQARFNLFARKIDPQGKLHVEQRVTATETTDLTPAMTTDANGQVWLAAQSWSATGHAGIQTYRCDGDQWTRDTRIIPAVPGNLWHPAVAASPDGSIAVAYDAYVHGNYDVHLSVFNAKKPDSPMHVQIASSPKFEARPSIVYDSAGRLWIAYEEGTEKWGKDFGSLAPGVGNPLYSSRSVRVVCLDTDGKLKTPTAELPSSTVVPPAMAGDPIKTSQFERATRFAYPKIGIDGGGRVWLTYRHNFGNRYSSHGGAYWLTFARRLDGQTWSEPIEVHHSDGLLDHRPVLLPDVNGGVRIVHNTDERYTTPENLSNAIYTSVIDLPAKATALQLVAHQPGENKLSAEVAAENAAVRRMKEHRLKIAGKTLQYLRGEYHRHTEISWDGAPDGSLEDMFRYAIDAAQMDWIGNGDHDNGAGREYSWWLTQKFTDAYNVPKAFTTMHTYERSVSYPHGHRNVMFAQRGIMTLPRLAPPNDGKKAEGGVHPDDAKMLYRYLHEFDGICAGHTSATGMGTDWRDNDPVVEPIVEIYQGDRMSYEMEGAPRAGYDPKLGKEPANVAGWFPKGYINHALKKGYKLAFQASSDHWSTHISFFIILAEANDRQSLLKAVKQRHCYAATDNILVDFRCGDAIMGDEVAVTQAPNFNIHVVGTGKIAKIDLLRDSEVVQTMKAPGTEFRGAWNDATADGKTHYYYIRVLQEDGEIAWGSPIWVTRQK